MDGVTTIAMPPDLAAFEASEIANWVRWVRGDGRMTGYGHCRSAEGNYVAPREDEQRLLRQAQLPIDEPGAELVERALSMLPCPRARLCIVLWYKDRKDPFIVARKIRLHHSYLSGFRVRAVGMLRAQYGCLQQDEVRLIRRGKTLWAGACRPSPVGV